MIKFLKLYQQVNSIRDITKHHTPAYHYTFTVFQFCITPLSELNWGYSNYCLDRQALHNVYQPRTKSQECDINKHFMIQITNQVTSLLSANTQGLVIRDMDPAHLSLQRLYLIIPRKIYCNYFQFFPVAVLKIWTQQRFGSFWMRICINFKLGATLVWHSELTELTSISSCSIPTQLGCCLRFDLWNFTPLT